MIVSILLVPTIACLFYDSWIGLFPGALAGLLYYKEWKKEKKAEKKRKLLLEFKSMMNAVDAALEGGYSLENSIVLAEKDITNEFGEKSELKKHLRVMSRKLALNEEIDTVMAGFAEDTDLEEIREFANVVHIIRFTGGNTIRIIRESVRTISERIDVENDIAAVIAGKKLEQRIMVLMPFIIILYMRLTMKGFMHVLYAGFAGRVFMTFMLLMVLAADKLGRHITDIKV